MRVEWNEAKNASNRKKHGVSFELANEVFDDPLARSVPERIKDGEQRWQTLGQVGGIVLLLVAHTWRDDEGEDVIRIISARRATKKEKREYERG